MPSYFLISFDERGTFHWNGLSCIWKRSLVHAIYIQFDDQFLTSNFTTKSLELARMIGFQDTLIDVNDKFMMSLGIWNWILQWWNCKANMDFTILRLQHLQNLCLPWWFCNFNLTSWSRSISKIERICPSHSTTILFRFPLSKDYSYLGLEW